MQKFKTPLLLSALVLLAALLATPQAAHALCLDYWAVGPSGCNGKQPPKTDKKAKAQPTEEVAAKEEPEDEEEAKPEEEMTEEEKKEAELQQDIEKFYTRHGKPPEEFVRFYMDPSPQNALAWVKKYNESINRSRQLAAAWTQAQQIYNNFDEQGLELPPELLPEHALKGEKELPPVQDLGLELPPGLEDVFGKKPAQQSPAPNGQGAIGGINSGGSAGGGIGGIGGSDRTQTLGDDRRIGGPLPDEAGQNLLKVSYYFSADCPFCKKFEPGLSKVAKEMKGKLEVTCVDMTPSGQKASNVHAGVECQWRPLLPGEKNAMGVEATPTLIIDRGEQFPLERLSGFVDESKLREHLNKKPQVQ